MTARLEIVARNEQPSPPGQVNLRRLEDDLRRASAYVRRALASLSRCDGPTADEWVATLKRIEADLTGRASLVRGRREGRLR